MKDIALTSQQAKSLSEGLKGLLAYYDKSSDIVTERFNKIEDGLSYLPQKVAEFHDEFEKLTGLREKDINLLIFACVMQALRVVIMEHFKKRLSDKEAAKGVPKHKEEHSDRGSVRYYASVDTIESNPVPYDTILKEEVVQKYDNPRLSGFNHRFKALGHDPYMGWIFGVANIMTNTITISEDWFQLKTYHVHTGIRRVREKPQYVDKMCARASTTLMFEKLYNRFRKGPKEAWTAFAHSLAKEWVHLHTDIRTKKSLPVPVISMASPSMTRAMQACGIDYLNIKIFEKEAFLSILINEVIKFAHNLMYNEKEDGDSNLYQVRTRKIVMLSNEIVTISDIFVVALRAYLGNEEALLRFDFGGAALTLWHVINDPIRIAEVKKEYVLKKSCEYINSL